MEGLTAMEFLMMVKFVDEKTRISIVAPLTQGYQKCVNLPGRLYIIYNDIKNMICIKMLYKD